MHERHELHTTLDLAGVDVRNDRVILLGREDSENRFGTVGGGRFDDQVTTPVALTNRDNPRAVLRGDVAGNAHTEIAPCDGFCDFGDSLGVHVIRVHISPVLRWESTYRLPL